ncbi:MAG TPA: aminotransferase class III-fold pyridoxal phosphate-dependent enzyme [Mycobacterium sp.]|nr:aminotransferase class III-fold pyridoxal phosphate-dependent enzyme [Mycobacterium sp.]HTX96954.1 aminotransferase class III-fold pyridoxal phosphate-dependent enzyme [Mycobacterium sp.]
MSALSRLDERVGLAAHLTYISADNATLVLVHNGVPRRIIDFMSCYGAVNFGHRNPRFEKCLSDGSDTVGVCYPPEAEQVARWLCAKTGLGDEGRVLFQVGGSFAVSTAVSLALRRRPGKMLAVEGCFHGLGADTLALTSIQHNFALQYTQLPMSLNLQVVTLAVGQLPDSWHDISCLLFEPVQGANGYVPLDVHWLRLLVSAAKSAGVTVIADEVQAGFYRHGYLSPSFTWGLDPDVYLYSKSLTNGMFPLSAVVYRHSIEPHERHAFLAHTFQTATLGYRAAHAVTTYLDEVPVHEMVSAIETELNAAAHRLRTAAFADDIHVCGPSLSFRPRVVDARQLAADALSSGLLVFVGGSDFGRIRVAPPVTIPIPQLREGLAILFERIAGCATVGPFVPAT